MALLQTVYNVRCEADSLSRVIIKVNENPNNSSWYFSSACLSITIRRPFAKQCLNMSLEICCHCGVTCKAETPGCRPENQFLLRILQLGETHTEPDSSWCLSIYLMCMCVHLCDQTAHIVCQSPWGHFCTWHDRWQHLFPSRSLDAKRQRQHKETQDIQHKKQSNIILKPQNTPL